MTRKIQIALGLMVLALGMAVSAPARADEQQIQTGYVFDGWMSDSVQNGYENRFPITYSFIRPNFAFRLGTAFVAGDYRQNDVPAKGYIGSDFSASKLSDSDVGMSYRFDLGESLKSQIDGNINIPTGDPSWEARQEQSGSIPYVFEPSFYHGRGWGMNLFYSMTSVNPGYESSLGMGYVATSTYDTGLVGFGSYYPGDTLIVTGAVAFKMTGADALGFRAAHTFPLESVNADPSEDFVAGQSSIFSTQWVSKMGSDKLVVNASYTLYNKGWQADLFVPSGTLIESPGSFLGDRLEIHPILGYVAGQDMTMESGLIWKRVFKNGYSFADTGLYQGGGNLFGVEQSVTFQLDKSTFWNVAGLYHFIANDDMGQNHETINYHRFTLGTNVGIKW